MNLSKSEYEQYLGILHEAEIQRIRSNYFFIFVHVILVIATLTLFSLTGDGRAEHMDAALSLMARTRMLSPILLPVIGIGLAIYWSLEQRELYIINEVRYRTLLRWEDSIFSKGIMREEWANLGRFSKKHSPVFFVNYARALPMIFLMAHCVVIAVTSLRYGILS